MAQASYWDTQVEVAKIPSGQNIIKIDLCTKNGRQWLSIREWYLNFAQELCPGKHGLAILLAPGTSQGDMIKEAMDKLAEVRAGK